MANGSVEFTAYFNGSPGSPKDKAVQHLVEHYGGHIVAAGTMLNEGVRDVCISIRPSAVRELKNALQRQNCWFVEDQ